MHVQCIKIRISIYGITNPFKSTGKYSTSLFSCQKIYMLYRVIQEERSVFWKVIVWVIVSKEVDRNMFPIMNDYGDNAIEIKRIESNSD